MTETEWLTCESPTEMLIGLQARQRASERRLRLFGLACCRHNSELFTDSRLQRAMDIALLYADGQADEHERVNAEFAVLDVFETQLDKAQPDGGFDCDPVLALIVDSRYTADVAAVQVESIARSAEAAPHSFDGIRSELQYEHTAYLRDIFGNPFRLVTVDPAWLTSTVVALARGMYESRDFSPMPILADALQDAGCDSEDVLDHCRGPGPHVRGCWVVDLVLGKQ
jgi:hypothetical protein